MQLQEVVPSVYCRVSYSRLGLESEAKLQTRVICLFMSPGEVLLVPNLSRHEVKAGITGSDVVDDVAFHSAVFLSVDALIFWID